MAWCLRYLHRLKERVVNAKSNDVGDHMGKRHESKLNLTVEELQRAEILIIRVVQSETFEKEIEMLTSTKSKLSRSKGNPQVNKTGPMYKLDPFVDDNSIL